MIPTCPVLVEAVTDMARLPAVQAIVAENKFETVNVRKEFGDVAVVEIVLPADVDPKAAIGWPKYVAAMDGLRKAGASFEGDPKPVIASDCRPEPQMKPPLAPSAYAFVLAPEDGRRLAASARQLNVAVTMYAGEDAVAVTLRAGQPTGSLMFRMRRGDFGALKEGGVLLPGSTVLNPAAALSRPGK